jgi:hypothetical protein
MIHAIKSLCQITEIPPTYILWLIDLNTISISLMAASLIDIPFLKPYCSVTSLMLVYTDVGLISYA